jgi:hypothetical protein
MRSKLAKIAVGAGGDRGREPALGNSTCRFER